MKKTMTKILLVLLAAALVLTCAACGKNKDKDAELEKENAALQAQLDELTAQMDELTNVQGVKDWFMSATPFTDATGATVKLSAVPGTYEEGQTAVFSVRLNGFEVDAVSCEWNGTSYTAEAKLEASDGYSYYIILSAPDGVKEQIALNTPENTVDDTLVYLKSSMVAYGNIIVDSWEGDEKELKLVSGFIQVQLPRISSTGKAPELSKAEMVFQLNGNELERRPLELPEGEGEGSYELAFQDVLFQMPKMENDYQLDLWLEVTLSDGSTISSCGGSWYHSGDDLMMLVG